METKIKKGCVVINNCVEILNTQDVIAILIDFKTKRVADIWIEEENILGFSANEHSLNTKNDWHNEMPQHLNYYTMLAFLDYPDYKIFSCMLTGKYSANVVLINKTINKL